jgi:hypothetical protein
VTINPDDYVKRVGIKRTSNPDLAPIMKATRSVSIEQGKQIYELYSQGYNDKQIAAKIGLKHKQVTHYRLHTLNCHIRTLTEKSNKRWSDVDDQYLRENAVFTMDFALSETLGRSIGSIKRRISTLKIDRDNNVYEDIPKKEEVEIYL